MMLLNARTAVQLAVLDLDQRRVPADGLRYILHELEAGIRRGDDLAGLAQEPYFIPNDVSRCAAASVLNCSHVDHELNIPAGFSIEATATRQTTFAKPYYIDPEAGIRRCQGLSALDAYRDRYSWTFDLAFVGHRGRLNSRAPAGLLADTSNTRYLFLRDLTERFKPPDAQVHVWLNDSFFFREPVAPEERQRRNRETQYIESICDSRFVLCPRGGGANSIRFFETLAACSVPIYVGDHATKLPLDWIIDWDKLCYRISCEEVADGSYVGRLTDILATPHAEVNRRRRSIFRVYHQFLAPERRPIFEHLVLLRARALLQAATARPTRES
jgi:hypothetical protein